MRMTKTGMPILISVVRQFVGLKYSVAQFCVSRSTHEWSKLQEIYKNT